jgi:hypothetical protein
VRKADSRDARGCLAVIHPLGDVVRLVPTRERRRQHGQLAVGEQQRLTHNRRPNVLRQAQPLQSCPRTFREGWVVVAGEQHPGARIPPHDLERAAKHLIWNSRTIEHIAGDEDSIRLPLACQVGKPRHGIEPLFAQQRGDVAFDRPEWLSQLPVSRVQDSYRHGPTRACSPRRLGHQIQVDRTDVVS